MLNNDIIHILLYTARSHMDQVTRDKVLTLLEKEPDWDRIVRSARDHRVLPLLYRNIKALHDETDRFKTILDRLKPLYILNASRNLKLTHHLLALLDLFKENNIFALPFKGPGLAQRLYNDIAMRQFNDLDILVSKTKLTEVFDLLVANGFRPEIGLDAGQFLSYARYKTELSFLHKEKYLPLDLHWELTGGYTPVPFDLESVRLDTVTLLDREVPALKTEDLLVYLCLHGTMECWGMLDRICVVGNLIRQKPGLDWDRVGHLAEKYHTRRILDLGLFMARDWLDAPIPQTLSGRIEKDPAIKPLSEWVLRILFSPVRQDPQTDISQKFSGFHFRVRNGFPEKIRYAAHLIFIPTTEDWQQFELPNRFSFCLFFTRPIRLFFKLLKTTMRRILIHKKGPELTAPVLHEYP